MGKIEESAIPTIHWSELQLSRCDPLSSTPPEALRAPQRGATLQDISDSENEAWLGTYRQPHGDLKVHGMVRASSHHHTPAVRVTEGLAVPPTCPSPPCVCL